MRKVIFVNDEGISAGNSFTSVEQTVHSEGSETPILTSKHRLEKEETFEKGHSFSPKKSEQSVYNDLNRSEFELSIRDLITNGLQNQTRQNNENQSQFHFRSHLLLLCCIGMLPLLSSDSNKYVKLYWQQNNLYHHLSVSLGDLGVVTLIDGATASEKWVLLSFFDVQEKESVYQWVELVMYELANKRNSTVCHSYFFSEINQVRELSKHLRRILVKHIRLGVSDRFSIDDFYRPIFDIIPDPFIESELTLAIEQGKIEMVKSLIADYLSKLEMVKPNQSFLGRFLIGILINIQQVLRCSPTYTLDMFYFDLNEAILTSSNYQELSHAICRMIDRLSSLSTVKGEEPNENKKLVKRMEDYIHKHYNEPINHQLLSEHFGYVPSYLSQIFKTYKGMSPLKYIVFLRVKAAKELLLKHPEWLVKDVAKVVGYKDTSYFSRIFKRETGMYPSDFRKKFRFG